jgi:hypothetical protein
MTREQKPTVAGEDLVQAFADLFEQVPPETPEEINAELYDAGLDPNQVSTRINSFIERALANSPLNPCTAIQSKLKDEHADPPTAPEDGQTNDLNTCGKPTTQLVRSSS